MANEPQPKGNQANVNPMFRVSVNKTDNSFTLIQEGITLNEEQAMQIYSAYREQIDLIGR